MLGHYQNASSTGALNSRQGYSVKLDTSGDLSFSGTINSNNVSIPISTGTRNNFNLVGIRLRLMLTLHYLPQLIQPYFLNKQFGYKTELNMFRTTP